MQFRLRAFTLHLLGSASALTLVLGSLYIGWYHWPGWYLTQALHVALIAALVDVALGPTLTLIIADPRKPRRELARDISIIVCVQLAALIYGAVTLWHGRPLYYTFSEDRLEVVQADEIKPEEAERGRRANPLLAPHWYSLPRWVWAPLPDDPDAAKKIMTNAISGGSDVVDMPRYFKPWNAGVTQLRTQLKPVADLTGLSAAEKQRLAARISGLGLQAKTARAIIMYGNARHILAVCDAGTAEIKALLATD